MKQRKTTYFWHGYIVCLCVTSLYQDMLGMDRYLAKARDNWIDAAWSVPVAIIVLVAVLVSYVVNEISKQKGDSDE